MKKNEKINFKDIFEICKLILKNNISIHVVNLLVWLLLSLFPLVFALLLRNLFSSLENFSSANYIKNIIIYTVIIIFNIFLTYKAGVFDTRSRFNIGKLLRVNLFSYFVNYDVNIDTSHILNSFNEDIDTIEEFISFSMDFINKIIFFLISFIILIKINYKLTIFVFTPLLLVSFLIYSCGEKIKKYYNFAKKEDLETVYFTSSIIKGNNIIKYFFNNKIIKNFEDSLIIRSKKNILKNFFFEVIEKVAELFNNISYVILAFASYLLLNSSDSISNFTLFIEYISYGTVYLIVFQEVFINLKSIQKFLENLSENLAISKEEVIELIRNRVKNKRKILEIPFNNSELGINLDRNEILIIEDDSIIKELKSKILDENKIAYVPKTINLFDDSIQNNITLFAPRDEKLLKKVMEISCIDMKEFEELIKKEKNIGRNGKKLSEGQRQRMAIARALYSRNEILLLDNCFSNIDYVTSLKIIEGLNKHKYTMIVLATDTDLFKEAKLRNRLNLEK